MQSRIDQLLIAMMEHEEKDVKRIHHFLKVHGFARLIGRMEGLPADVQETLEAAAVVHDIGIHLAERKYGNCDGPHQEQEGPAVGPGIAGPAGLGAVCNRAGSLAGRASPHLHQC